MFPKKVLYILVCQEALRLPAVKVFRAFEMSVLLYKLLDLDATKTLTASSFEAL